MEKVRYMIGDAANRIQVEAHVLRYWEEELDLEVPRNELGHRYYTEENLKQFEEIKRLKEEGFQLKAIKMLIHNRPVIRDEDICLVDDLYIGNHPKEQGCEDNSKATASKNCCFDKESSAEAGALQELSADTISLQREVRESGKNGGKENFAEIPDGEKASYTVDASGELSEENAVMTTSNAQPAPLSKLEQFQMMMSEIVRNAIAENNQALGQEVSVQVGEQVLKEMNYLMRDREEQEEERFRKLDEAIRTHQRRLRRSKSERKKEKARKVGLRTGESVS